MPIKNLRSAVLMTLFGAIAAMAYAQTRRPLVIDDLFDIQTLTGVRISPDGASIAVVIQRAWSDPVTYRPYSMFGNDHADVWIMPAEAGSPRNVTRGSKDGSGYWNPIWSPDGERLALLSTAGGDNVRAYVWEKRSGRLIRVAERGVDLSVRTNATGDANPLQWLDRTRLLVTVLPEGELPQDFRLRRQTAQIASEAWKKLARGLEPTASVLESGFPPGQERSNRLLLVDVATMRAQILAEANIRSVLLSPDREHIAVIAQARRPSPVPGQLLGSVYAAPSRLGIVALRGESSIRWVVGVFNPTVTFGESPHRWSPRGSALAVLGSERAEADSPRAVFVVSPSDLSIHRPAANFVPSALAWSAGEQLLIRAPARGQAARSDWWCFASPHEEPLNLTSALTAVPTQLMGTQLPNQMVGLAGGALWSFDVMSGKHRPLTNAGRPPVSAIVWPGAEQRLTSVLESMIVRVREDAADSYFRVSLSTSGVPITNFPHPPKATALAGYHPERNLAVFSAPQDSDGTFLWTGRGATSEFARRMALNEQMAGIAGAEHMLIDYRSADGQALKAILLLPVGYKKGTRYPLMTWVYPGAMIRDVTSQGFWIHKNQAHQDNLHLLAARGYAVLIPSMPTPVNLNARSLDVLTNGVLPAVDHLVELGIVDGERVAVGGQSGGGFVTYGLITQTARFKAAVVISGPSNHIMSYSVFSGERRYVGDVEEILLGGSEGRFGSPPWVDPDPYVKNSPITFIDRVETPLLIIHGDIDYVPIQHAEEIFTGLARLGKPVRFVRYWGESHGASDSPANLRDRWLQIFRWLDLYLREAR